MFLPIRVVVSVDPALMAVLKDIRDALVNEDRVKAAGDALKSSTDAARAALAAAPKL